MNPLELELKDSQIEGEVKENPSGYILGAVDKLNRLVESKDKSIQVIPLTPKRYQPMDLRKFVWYEIEKTKKHGSHDFYKFEKVKFYTSHYVGFYTTSIENQSVSITINPRFGNAVRNYLFENALGLYVPKGESQQAQDKQRNLWLIALMWKVNLEKALTLSHIPRVYKMLEQNQRYFRGRLLVNEHIRHNIMDESRFYCTYSKFSLDSAINRAIRCTYRILSKWQEYRAILQGVAEHDQMLADFGVSNDPISVRQIENIRYSPMNIAYKPLMEICKAIISYKSFENAPLSRMTSDFAVFLDMSEVWENYIYKLLVRNLDGFDVISPNLVGGDYLFEGDKRPIRPDILIKKHGKVVAIIDAKYKWYKKIDSLSNEPSAVSIEDLYQMVTYLSRFGDKDAIGLFVTPCEDEKEGLCKIEHSKHNHCLGVVGLNVDVSIKKKDENNKEIEDKDETLKAVKENEERMKNVLLKYFIKRICFASDGNGLS